MLEGGVIAFGATIVLMPTTIVILRRLGVLDYPNARSSHDRPVIRGGGLAVLLGALVGLVVAFPRPDEQTFGVIIAGAGLAAIGLVEDLKGVPALPRLGLQLVAAAASLPWLLRDLTGPTLWQALFGAGVLIWLVGYTNAFNFMDGINGISGAQTVIAGAAWMTIGTLQEVPFLALGGAIAVGSAIAFLPFNFPNARVFLGDVGSYFLGGWLAGLLVLGLRAGLPPEALLAPLALYLVDTGTTLIRRVREGEPWHTPHRQHVYQELVKQGWSHTATTGIVSMVLVVLSGLGFLSLAGNTGVRVAGNILLVTALAAYLALPHLPLRRDPAREAVR